MLSRLTSLLALALLLTGCASVFNLANSTYDVCPSSTDTTHQYFGSPDADDLVIFIHGLCGDAKTTWTNPTTHFVFPEELARDFAKENQPAYVVAFDYVSRLQGGPSIPSIADHLEFEIGELLKKHPYRRLRIVAHSMGGLVAREYILRRQLRAHPQLKVTNVVLLATPNNGSELAELGRLISESRQVEELRHIDKGNTYLESLNKDWNREFKGGGHPHHVLLYAGYEELAMPVLGQVVKLSSAISYADESMGFQQDHVSIAKPKERSVLYRWVKARLGESLEKTARQLLDGMVKQRLLAAADVPQELPRTVKLLEGLHVLAGTELEQVLTYVKAGQFQAALALFAESEPQESQLIQNIAQRRFVQGQIHELQFEKAQAASYYSQAVQLAPTNSWYRQGYGGLLLDTGDTQSAVLQFEEVVRLSRTSRDSLLEGVALGGLGGAYVDLAQYTKAHEYFEQALAIHRMIGDIRGEGRNLGNLGIVYAHLGQYTRAIEHFELALAIDRKYGDVQGEATALGNLGNAYDGLSQYAKAIEFLEQALSIHRKISDVRSEGSNLGSLGSVYKNVGEYAKAIEFHEQALAIARKVGDVRREGGTLVNLGNAYAHLGQYDKAVESHEQALVIDRRIGNVEGEGKGLGALGSAYADLGQYAKAIESYEQALALRRKIGDLQGEGRALENLGTVYGELGQNAKAIEFIEQALTIHRKVGDVRSEGTALGNLGTAYNQLGQYAKALEYYEEALAIHRKIRNVSSEGKALGNLGAVYDNLGQYDKAIQYLDQALTIHRKIGDVRGEGSDLGNLSSAYAHLGQDAKAIEYLNQALVISRKIGDARGEGNALGNLGSTYDDLRQHDKAFELLKASEVIFEDRLRVTFPWKARLERLKNEPRK